MVLKLGFSEMGCISSLLIGRFKNILLLFLYQKVPHQSDDYWIVYPVHVMTRKSFGLMTRKLSVTESQRSAQFPETFSRRKLSVASANWAQVA